MKKIVALFLSILIVMSMASCKSNGKTSILIYAASEEYRIEAFDKRLKEKFPDYDIKIEYYPSGNLAAKVQAEGTQTDADIILELEYGYLEKVLDSFADLSDYDFSIYTDDMVDANKKLLPDCKSAGCIAISKAALDKAGVSEPETYEDLLKPEYKGLISMPNPKTSGTGYMFLKSLVNAWGEEKAFDYFDKLAENTKFTSSGSGPVNDIISGEAAIGLAMTAQVVSEINKGMDFKIKYFEEGSPFTGYGLGIVEGKQDNPGVKEVFDYFINTLIPLDKEEYFPEKIYKDKDFTIENYPTGIKYADMSGNTSAEKERLLSKWTH